MNRYRIFISLISINFLLSCSKIDSRELPGTYVFNQSDTGDTLIVLTDNTYKHTAYINNERQLNSGTWKFNGREIDFQNFTFFNGGNGVWSSRVIKDDDIIKLNYAEEQVYYLKVK